MPRVLGCYLSVRGCGVAFAPGKGIQWDGGRGAVRINLQPSLTSRRLSTRLIGEKQMIRKCTPRDVSVIHTIINEAAQAYRGVIPEDRWHEPYMSIEELRHEIDDGVEFWGYEEAGELVGVMGLQDKGDLHLIRHAYVRTSGQNRGIGTKLLRHLERMTDKPILVGTWADATWAMKFYERNGYRVLSRLETERLLKKYWRIPERQVVTSVVLANSRWRPDKKNGEAVP